MSETKRKKNPWRLVWELVSVVAENGTQVGRTVGLVVGVLGGITLLSSVGWQHIESIGKDSQMALEVVAQHGHEFVDVRNQVNEVRNMVYEVKALADLGGRFTREDGQRLEDKMDRMLIRIERLEARVHYPQEP